MRPAVAQERVTRGPDKLVRITLNKPFSDGTLAVDLDPLSLLIRLLDHVELYVNGRNLTNDRYLASRRPYGARPGAPLWMMAGVRGEF